MKTKPHHDIWKMGRIRFLVAISFGLVSFGAQAQDIHRTACQGKLERLDSLLNDTTGINVQDGRGRSLLHYAVGCRQKEVLHFLIDRGININIQDNRGETPLFVAVQTNNEPFFKALIDLHSTGELKEKYGGSLLEKAVLNGNLNFVNKLVDKGVPLDEVNKRGSTALEIALRDGPKEVADYLISKGADIENVRTFELQGKYMNQIKPDSSAIIFAPNFISTENFVHNGVFHPNGKEFYYTIETRRYNRGTIMVSKLDGGKWSKSEPASIPGTYREVGPFISKDGLKLYYATNRPVHESDTLKSDVDIWVMDRDGDGWGPPVHLGEGVNTEGNDWFPTIADNGTLYYYTHREQSGNIYYSTYRNGKYEKGVLIDGVGNGEYYNYDPFIAPDESYIIFASSGRPEGEGRADLYISFKNDQNKWSKPKNMGEGVNSSESEYAPLLTPDGKYLFFARGHGDVYWINTQIIESLK